MVDTDLKDILRDFGLRATAPRLAVLEALRAAGQPLTHAELTEAIGEPSLDRVTVYRNLHRLVEVGLARVASEAGGVGRYEAVRDPGGDDPHQHPHFACTDCGTVECLPEQPAPAIQADSRWQRSLSAAAVQLQGTCPDCIDAGGTRAT